MNAGMLTFSVITAPATWCFALLACCTLRRFEAYAANTTTKDAFINELVSQMTVPEMGEPAFGATPMVTDEE